MTRPTLSVPRPVPRSTLHLCIIIIIGFHDSRLAHDLINHLVVLLFKQLLLLLLLFLFLHSYAKVTK